ncbi:MAG: NADH-quinone oxidoreductase subunit NuoH [Planctomycetes bacterium]|nr:NADH-quinone oxidoreductase subunit NuoH [Planctomycetota bacterium]
MFDFFCTQFGFSLLLAATVFGAIMGTVAYCIYFERRISAWIQDRHGPNRVGPWGLLQPIADGLKFILKEDIIPGRVDRPLFILAPCLIFIVSMIMFVVIPWGGQVDLGGPELINVQVANPDIGLLYVLGIASMGIYGVVLGGWASNNKYSQFGAMRAAAQMLSYEIPMGLAILVVVLVTGEVRLEEILLAQVGTGTSAIGDAIPHYWNILLHPLAFMILLITVFAESNRTPFDVAEAEQELVGGYHTEYSAMKFALFFLAEYAHMITASAFIAVLFLGGWHLPFVPGLQPGDTSVAAMGFKMLILGVKIAGFLFFFMLVRWTVPRFRFDQIMRLAWKGLVPMSMGLVALAAVLVYAGKQHSVAWSLSGNAIVLLLTIAVAASTRQPVTGRQANMPALPATAAGA